MKFKYVYYLGDTFLEYLAYNEGKVSMLSENEIVICDKLFKYINSDLCDYHDSEIFTKLTMQELGEFYFNKSIDTVDGVQMIDYLKL